jgi:hypothetical protein
MNRLACCLFILFFIGINVQAENLLKSTNQDKQRLFYFAPSIGFGFFYPTEVNDYIESQYDITINGSMYVYYHVGANGAFFFSRLFELQLGAEIAGSPKFAFVDDDVDYYGYRRITPNAKFNFHIPAGRKLSVILGAGVSYSTLRFKAPHETITNNDLGYSLQTGVKIQFKRNFAYAPTLVFNGIKAKADPEINNMGFITRDIDLSYIGVQLNNVIYF